MLHLQSSAVRDALWSARFGLEREALRVTTDGRMALTPHPFPQDDPRIARAFSAPSHGHEYIASPDDFRLFFTDYAAL